jgi:voltage-gated potassium channel
MTLQERVWYLLEPWGSGSRAARIVGGFVGAVILVAVAATVAESVPRLHRQYRAWFQGLELFCIAVFVLEYCLRLWAVGCDPRYRGLVGRLRWMATPWAVIDLAAILPALLVWADFDLRIVRAVRLVRLFRIGRYSRGLRLLVDTFRGSFRQLAVAFSGVLILLLFASVAAYLAERDAQPDTFGTIPDAMWWAICTVTTVGYGDAVPHTVLGRTIAGTISLLGVITVAVPAGIFAAGFARAAKLEESDQCPHCGESLTAPPRDRGAAASTAPNPDPR